jgi:hypothetical protein
MKFRSKSFPDGVRIDSGHALKCEHAFTISH